MNAVKKCLKVILWIVLIVLFLIAIHWGSCAICLYPAVSTDGNWNSYIMKGYYDVFQNYDSYKGLLYYSGQDPLPRSFTVTVKGAETGHEETTEIDTVANPKTWKLNKLEELLLLRGQENACLYIDGYGSRAPEEDLSLTIDWEDAAGEAHTEELQVYKVKSTPDDYFAVDRFLKAFQ